MTKRKSISRNVLEGYTRDVGRGIIRIDYDTMDELNIATGDPVLLLSKSKKSAAKALPLYPSDEGKGFVRLDGVSRENLDIQVASTILIEKPSEKTKQAEQIIVHSAKPIPEIDATYLADALESLAVMVGMKVNVPYFGSRLTFKILDTRPEGVVLITQRTEFIIEDEDLPDEVREFEEFVKVRKQEILGDIDTTILKLLSQKKYDELKVVMNGYYSEIAELMNMKKQIREILADKRNIEYGKT